MIFGMIFLLFISPERMMDAIEKNRDTFRAFSSIFQYKKAIITKI
jgi:hypothetical protein